ncbi:hypothetical protein ABIE62_000788 [Porphyrobacter sp. MBR-155]|uniref:hypothetical protein n=1 Tax=Porphyrobacter sp. MBR-155 TaxID=3156464 RepID=UPI003393B9B5
MLKFLTSPEWLAFSSVASVLGLGVALWGIWFAIEQIKKVKSSSEAAEEAIQALKFRIASFDIFGEVAIAERSLEAMKEELKSEDEIKWRREADNLMKSLINIRENFAQANDKTSQQLSTAIKRASNLANKAENGHRRDATDLAKINDSFREIHIALVKVKVQIQRD